MSHRSERIIHIPRILYHLRTEVEAEDINRASFREKEAFTSSRRAVEDYLRDANIPAKVEEGRHPGRWRVRYALPVNPPPVSIVIPSGGNLGVLERNVNTHDRVILFDHLPGNPAAVITSGWHEELTDAIDAHLFEDADGSFYLYYANLAGGFKILVQPMADPLTMEGEAREVIRPTEPWEKGGFPVTEAPFMLKREGIYYLMYSGSPADSAEYGIGYATAETPMGPFVKHPGNPIAKRSGNVLGPGHHSVVDAPDGKLWMVYHQKLDDAMAAAEQAFRSTTIAEVTADPSSQPLRERKADLPSLLLIAIDRACRALGRAPIGIAPEAQAQLVEHVWPGNLAELQWVVERAVARCEGTRIGREALGSWTESTPKAAAEPHPLEGTYEEVEQRLLAHALERAAGNKSEAARLLGLKRTTFLDRLRRHDLDDPARAIPQDAV
jgi:hypothetical protein